MSNKKKPALDKAFLDGVAHALQEISDELTLEDKDLLEAKHHLAKAKASLERFREKAP